MNHAQPPRQPAVCPSSFRHAALALGLSLCIAAPGFCGEPSPGKLYYINSICKTIYRMDLADPDQQPVHFLAGSNRWQLALHGCKMYWSDLDLDTVQRCNWDGSGLETVIENLGGPQGVAIDPVAEKLYFTTAFNGQNAVIRKANLDGSNPEVVLPLAGLSAAQLTLDVSAGKMYWNQGGSGLWRANLDGTDLEPVVASSAARSFALDLDAGHIYFHEFFSGAANDVIRRANLDGSNPQPVLTGLEAVGPVAVDSAGGKIYWGDGSARRTIWRANLNGTQIEQLTPDGTCNAYGFVIAYGDVDATCGPHDTCPPKADCEAVESIYWVDGGGAPPWTGRIWRSNADGTGVQMLLELPLPYHDPNSIAIDKAGGKIYITLRGFTTTGCTTPGCPAAHVVRANLDGTGGLEPLVTLPHVPGAGATDIALDLSAGKMYFKRQGFPTLSEQTIYRANLDGSDLGVIYTGALIGRLNLDVVAGMVYFSQPNRIVRANINTVPLAPQDVIVESSAIDPVGFDFGAGKVYYLLNTDTPGCDLETPPLAKRANLNGTNIETLGTHANLRWCSSTAEVLDIASQRLYRIPGGDPGGGNCGILRSNFADGSERFCTMFPTAGTEKDVTLVMRDVVPGDITGDGIVDVNDLLAVVGTWGPCPQPPAPCPTDIAPAPNGDGVVNVNDLLMVIGNWS